jgi:hypothetical protein
VVSTNSFVKAIPLGGIGNIGSMTVCDDHTVKIEAKILKSCEVDYQKELLDIQSGEVLGMKT